MKKRVAVLGATGSIGRSTMDVLREHKNIFDPVLLSAHSNETELLSLARDYPEALLVLSGRDSGGDGIHFFGPEGLCRAIRECGAHITVNGISGSAGLMPSLAALETGGDLALANKESIVMAASLVFKTAETQGGRIIPVDSEHSAVFHLLEAHGRESLDEIILTASGGPFRTFSAKELETVTPADALAHPTWNMGPKITIDSASLANKGLEVIEAVRLFNAPPEKVRVLIHPQSMVHSLIRLRDGALYAQISRPDMRLPIQNALFWPECRPCSFGRLEFDRLITMDFDKPDYERFPMLPLAYEAAARDGLYPAVYNAANEAAAGAFLTGRISFLDIPAVTAYVLNKDFSGPADNLEAILSADAEARRAAEKRILEIGI